MAVNIDWRIEVSKRMDEIKARLIVTSPGQWGAANLPYDGITEPKIISECGSFIAQTVCETDYTTKYHAVNEDTIFLANAKADIRFLMECLDEIFYKY